MVISERYLNIILYDLKFNLDLIETKYFITSSIPILFVILFSIDNIAELV